MSKPSRPSSTLPSHHKRKRSDSSPDVEGANRSPSSVFGVKEDHLKGCCTQTNAASKARNMGVDLVYGGNIAAACAATNAVARPIDDLTKEEQTERKMRMSRINAQRNRDRKRVIVGLLENERDQLTANNNKLRHENQELRNVIRSIGNEQSLGSISRIQGTILHPNATFPTAAPATVVLPLSGPGSRVLREMQSLDRLALRSNLQSISPSDNHLVNHIQTQIMIERYLGASRGRSSDDPLVAHFNTLHDQSFVASVLSPSMANSTQVQATRLGGWTRRRGPGPPDLYSHHPESSFDLLHLYLHTLPQSAINARSPEGGVTEQLSGRTQAALRFSDSPQLARRILPSVSSSLLLDLDFTALQTALSHHFVEQASTRPEAIVASQIHGTRLQPGYGGAPPDLAFLSSRSLGRAELMLGCSPSGQQNP